MRDTEQPTTKHIIAPVVTVDLNLHQPTGGGHHRVIKCSYLLWTKGDRTFKLGEHEHDMELARLPSRRAGTEPTALKFTVIDTLNRGHVEVCRWEEPWVGQTFVYLSQQVYDYFCTIDVVYRYLSHYLDLRFQSSGHMPNLLWTLLWYDTLFNTCSITKWGTLFRPCLSSHTAALHRAKLC